MLSNCGCVLVVMAPACCLDETASASLYAFSSFTRQLCLAASVHHSSCCHIVTILICLFPDQGYIQSHQREISMILQGQTSGAMNSAFNCHILAEKLSKLNGSQQSIETLSHWCIFHRKNAHQAVETWNKQFLELPKEQRVHFLYLANDILQNSRRRGGEFVSEFWRILPGALKVVIESGDDHACNVVFRLVDIWEERKVFGSRARSLREELLGKDPPPDLPENSVKSCHMIKVKVPVGGIQEKLASAFQYVHDAATDEDVALGRCNAAVMRIEGLEKEVEGLSNRGDMQDTTTLTDELQEQHTILRQCHEQFEMSEMAHAALVSHLKEALREQESKLELFRTQLQVSQAESQRATNLQKRLLTNSPRMGDIIHHGSRNNASGMLHNNMIGHHIENPTRADLVWPSSHVVERNAFIISDEPQKSKSAAEVAAKLAASTSSAQMLTSVLSSLAAEEVSPYRSTDPSADVPSHAFYMEKRLRVGEQMDKMYSSEGNLSYAYHYPPPPTLQNDPMQHASGPMQYQTSSVQQAASLQLQVPPSFPPPPQFVPGAVNMAMSNFKFVSGIPHPPPVPMHFAVAVPHVAITHQNPAQGPYQPLQQPSFGFYRQPPPLTPPMPRH